MNDLRSNVVKITESITKYGLFVLTVLMPLLFLPFTSEFYEFNKSILFLGIMLIVLVSWLVNLAFSGSVSFWKTSFDVWMIGILGSVVVSLLFSEHKNTSIFGYSIRLSEGVIVLFFLMVFTLIVRHVVKTHKILDFFKWGIVSSGAVVGLITFLQYFGIYVFGGFERYEFTKVRGFSTLGSTQVLPFFFLALVPIALGFLLVNAKEMKKAIPLTVIFVLNIAGFVISSGNFWSWPGVFLWIAFAAAVVLVLISSGAIAKASLRWLLATLACLVVFFVVRNVEGISEKLVIGDDAYAQQPSLQYDMAWSIAAESLSQSPIRGLFGTGPDTFAYDFTRYRPAEYNSKDTWNIRFSRSANQFFETMTNTGVIGVGLWVAFFVVLGIWLSKVLKEDHSYPFRVDIMTLTVALGLIVLSSFVTFFTINIWYLFWLFLGLIVATRAFSNPRISEKINLTLSLSKEKIAVERQNDVLPYVMLIPAVLLLVGGLSWMYKLYNAEVNYQNAIYSVNTATQNDDAVTVLVDSYNDVTKAIDSIGFKDTYYADRAIISINILSELSRRSAEDTEGNQDYQSDMNRMLAEATKNAEKATEINPLNVRNWETRIVVYQELIKITNGGYGDAAVSAINEALKYDPVKPQLYHQRGVIYSLANQDEAALEELRKALSLQPLLLDARYDLAMQYQKMGKNDDAKAQLQIILNILEANGLGDTEAYNQVQNAMNAIGSDTTDDEVPTDSDEVDFPPAGDVEEGSDEAENQDENTGDEGNGDSSDEENPSDEGSE